MDDGDHRIRIAAEARRGCPALFLDRDGTLIDDPGYLADPEDVRLFGASLPALRRFREAGYALVLVTNQSGIGRGLYDWNAYEAVAARLRELLAAGGLGFDAELACGHAPEAGASCGWRKPAPGMILAAAGRLDLDLGRSILAGDKLSDVEAGMRAGVGRIAHVATGQGREERASVVALRSPRPIELVDDLSMLRP